MEYVYLPFSQLIVCFSLVSVFSLSLIEKKVSSLSISEMLICFSSSCFHIKSHLMFPIISGPGYLCMFSRSGSKD